MLHLTDITYRIEGRMLLDHATAVVPNNKRMALFGRNGTGKSTLFRIIMGELSPESGEVHINPRARVMAVAQEAPGGPESLLQTVLDSHKELADLNLALDNETDPMKLAEVHARLGDIDAHSAPARAATILAGLGFDEVAIERPCSEFSGGWRMRVALASALFNQPDLLLLDEPTNYLDVEGIIWLENFLKSYPYSVLIISHDRDLLNNCVDGIIHLENQKLTTYTGGYDQFEETRRLQQERQMALKAKQEAARRDIEAFVNRFKAKASKAKQAQSRMKMLEKMKPIASATVQETIPFRFPKADPLSPPLINLDDVAVGYGTKQILSKLNLYIDMEDRIGLLGQNGNGKSTFAKLLVGQLKAMAGKYSKPKSLKIGYFAQHQLDELRPNETALEHLQKLMPDLIESKLRAQLGSFGFGEDKADRPVSTFSGGEKARLLMALMSREKPHLMILDEPTNHLDVDSREALIHALNNYDGALILITHDRHMIEACVDRLMLIEKGSMHRFDGDMQDYRQHLLRERRAANAEKRAEKPSNNAPSQKEVRKQAAEQRAALAPLKKAVSVAEKEMDRIADRLTKVDKALALPSLYEVQSEVNTQKITLLQQEKSKLENELAIAEESWMDAQEALELAEAGIEAD